MSLPGLFAANHAMARSIARDYFIPGQDRADTQQEALIALWQACRDYRPQLGEFRSFARFAIHRDLQDALKGALRGKQLVLTHAVRDYDMPASEDACSAAIQRERVQLIVAACRRLSSADRVTLRRIVNDAPYSTKADDNARYRVRLKLKAAA